MSTVTQNILRVWFALNAVIGLALVFWIPPYQSPDEPNHFFRAYSVSIGHWQLHPTADYRLGDSLPASLSMSVSSFLYVKNNYSARVDPNAWRVADTLPLVPAKKIFTDFANTAIYAPTAYLPQAVGIWAARRLGAGPLRLLYAARAANLVVWLIFMGLSLRMAPGKPFAWMMAASFPSVTVMAASANADILTNGLCFWCFAWFWRNRPGFQGAALMALLLAGIQKLVTWPLVWLFPAHASVSGRRRWLWPVLITLAAAGYAWTARESFVPYDRYHVQYRDGQTLNVGVDPAGQLQYILTHPIRFTVVCIKSWVRAVPSIAAHLTGKFGWEKNYLPSWVIALLWVSWLGLLVMEQGPTLSRRRVYLYGAVLVGYIGLFSITMYALWHPVGSDTLENLQGRYFFPLLPLAIIMSAAWQPIRPQWFKWWVVLAFTGWVVSQLALFWAIWMRYWT